MAEAKAPRRDQLENSDGESDQSEDLDEEFLQWTRWRKEIDSFKDKDEREREELLQDLEKNMPAKLKELNEGVRTLDWRLFGYSEPAFKLTKSLELAVSSNVEIDSEQLDRLNRLETQLKASHVPEYRATFDIFNDLFHWSSELEDWAKLSDKDLLALLDELHEWTECKGKLKDLPNQFEKAGWADTLFCLYKDLIEDINGLNQRLREILDDSELKKSRSVADRLKQTQTSVQNYLNSELTIKDVAVINVTKTGHDTGNPATAFHNNERIMIEMHRLTKRSIEYVKDVLLSEEVVCDELDLTTESGIQLVREVDGKVNFIISRGDSNSHEKYFLRFNRGYERTRLSATMKNKLHCVTAHLPQSTMVYVTSTTEEGLRLDPTEGYSHVCPENENVLVEFPAGCTSATQNISIQLEPTTFNESLFPPKEVMGYSDVIYIEHDGEFLKPISVTLPLTLIGDKDISACELFCVHINDDGVLSIKDDVEVEHLGRDLCRFETDSFSGSAVKAKRKQRKSSKKDHHRKFENELRMGLGTNPHTILIFIGDWSKANTWKIHAEVVEDSNITDTIRKRRDEMSLFELSKCRSPSFRVARIRQIEVFLGSKGSLCMFETKMQQRTAINIIKGAANNFISFPVTRKNKENMATVHFVNYKAGKRHVIHKAFFDPRDLNTHRYSTVDPPSDLFVYPTTIRGRARQVPMGNEQLLPTAIPGSSTTATPGSSTTVTPGSSMTSLDIPDPQSPVQSAGFFSTKSMLVLTKQISLDEMWQLSVHLEIPDITYKDLKAQYKDSPTELRLRIMQQWLGDLTCSEERMASILCNALGNVPLPRIRNIVDSVFKQKRGFELADFRN